LIGYVVHTMNSMFSNFSQMNQMNDNNHRVWEILSQNIRGINSVEKWNSLKNKIIDLECDIVCIQETKRGHF
jgi:pyruvate/oxaloacetate carboxyltransferase